MAAADDDAKTPAQRVADGLRDAFAALGASSLPAEERARWQRRLLAITTTSKRDVARAQEQLGRFTLELDAAERVVRSTNDE